MQTASPTPKLLPKIIGVLVCNDQSFSDSALIVLVGFAPAILITSRLEVVGSKSGIARRQGDPSPSALRKGPDLAIIGILNLA